MSETLTLQAEARDELNRHVTEKLRAAGKIPAVLYGNGVATAHLTVEATAFNKVLGEAGESTIVSLEIGGDKRNVIIHDIQRNAVGEAVMHVDFYQVNMSEEITAEVEIEFEGVAPAEKALGGVVVKNLDHVAVRALPQNLPHHIIVDLTKLATFDDVVRVADLQVPEGAHIEHAEDDVVVSVAAPRSEAELDALNTEVVADVDQVEVAGKPAEGAAEGEGEQTAEKK